jgi:GNAT superfamily N-acetyltransferase
LQPAAKPRDRAAIRIRSLSGAEAVERTSSLSDILIDCVEGGASVSFMAPLARAKADAFWSRTASAVAEGERILLVAESEGRLLGTVQIVLAQPENQPHRADVSKMLVLRAARKNGIGQALTQGAEEAARAACKTLLVLDTAADDAERLYTRLNWIFVGEIPGYALFPDGRPCATRIFYKVL